MTPGQFIRNLILSGMLSVPGGAVSAATISVSTYSVSDYNAILGGFGNVVSEDFEGYQERNVDDGFLTAVGAFSTVGGTGSGGSVSNADFANDGSKLALRDGWLYGRTSTTKLLTGRSTDDMFLDSNDTHGIRWSVSIGGGLFDRILLTLTDAADTGATMTIRAGGEEVSFKKFRDANRQIVLIDFGEGISSAEISFSNYRGGNLMLNDGFSLDDIAVSAVPVPMPGVLLLAGVAGLVAVRRKRTA